MTLKSLSLDILIRMMILFGFWISIFLIPIFLMQVPSLKTINLSLFGRVMKIVESSLIQIFLSVSILCSTLNYFSYCPYWISLFYLICVQTPKLRVETSPLGYNISIFPFLYLFVIYPLSPKLLHS